MITLDDLQIVSIKPGYNSDELDSSNQISGMLQRRFNAIKIGKAHKDPLSNYWKIFRESSDSVWKELYSRFLSLDYDILVMDCWCDVTRLCYRQPAFFTETPIVYIQHQTAFENPQSKDSVLYELDVFNEISVYQIVDIVIFPSRYTKERVISGLKEYLNEDMVSRIASKFKSISFPLDFNKKLPWDGKYADIQKTGDFTDIKDDTCIKIIWNSRVEYDREPEIFVKIIKKLEKSHNIAVMVCTNEKYKDSVPVVFKEIKHLIKWEGYNLSDTEYARVLRTTDLWLGIVDSESFGISALDAIYGGSLAIFCDRGSYPELIDMTGVPELKQKLIYEYKDVESAVKKVEDILKEKDQISKDLSKVIDKVSGEANKKEWEEILLKAYIDKNSEKITTETGAIAKMKDFLQNGSKSKEELMKHLGWSLMTGWPLYSYRMHHQGIRKKLINGATYYSTDNVFNTEEMKVGKLF